LVCISSQLFLANKSPTRQGILHLQPLHILVHIKALLGKIHEPKLQ